MSTKHKITRAAELEALEDFRAFIAQTAKSHNIDDDTIFSLQLATDEACSNVILHGYSGMDPGSVILELTYLDHKIIVQITDFGHPFEPSQAPTPDINAPLEERDLGGFGLYFIYSVMDSVDYKTDEDGNRLILTKQY